MILSLWHRLTRLRRRRETTEQLKPERERDIDITRFLMRAKEGGGC